MKGGHGLMVQQNSYLTVIVVHSTMHLMHHNHCQITIIVNTVYYIYYELIRMHVLVISEVIKL